MFGKQSSHWAHHKTCVWRFWWLSLADIYFHWHTCSSNFKDQREAQGSRLRWPFPSQFSRLARTKDRRDPWVLVLLEIQVEIWWHVRCLWANDRVEITLLLHLTPWDAWLEFLPFQEWGQIRQKGTIFSLEHR